MSACVDCGHPWERHAAASGYGAEAGCQSHPIPHGLTCGCTEGRDDHLPQIITSGLDLILRHVDGTHHREPADLVQACEHLAGAVWPSADLDLVVLRKAFDALEEHGWGVGEEDWRAEAEAIRQEGEDWGDEDDEPDARPVVDVPVAGSGL